MGYGLEVMQVVTGSLASRDRRRRSRNIALALLATWSLAAGCSAREGGAEVVALRAAEFSTRLGATAGATLLDVRTPGEFAKGHLARAVNVDWSARDFDRRVAGLDRTKPVFVYCLTGSRSAEAARRLASAGFPRVFDLAGGILAWRAAGLPQEAAATATRGLTRAEFEGLVAGDKSTLIDFYADWCIPCRQMKPWLEELGRTRASDLRVERIDADDNQALLRELGIDALPTLELFRGGKEVWKQTGLTTRDEVIARLDDPR